MFQIFYPITKNMVIVIFVFSLLFVSASGYSVEISEESKKIVDSFLDSSMIVYDSMSDQLIPDNAISLDSLDYLIRYLLSDNLKINRRYLVVMIANIYDSNPEKLKDKNLDQDLIQFIQKMEDQKQYDSEFYGNVYGCLGLLGKIRSKQSAQFLQSRIDLHYWDDKSITVYDTKNTRVMINETLYRREQRETALHMLCQIQDATSEIFLQGLILNENDPDSRNMLYTINFHRFDFLKNTLCQNQTGVLAERYRQLFDDLFTLKCGMEAYYLDQGTYPRSLDEIQKYIETIPKDRFNSKLYYSYNKTNQGYELWSVGPNGKTDELNTIDYDDIDVSFP